MTVAPRVLRDPRNSISASEQRRSSRYSGNKKKDAPKESMRALKMQRALANVSYEKRGRVKEIIGDRDEFGQFDLLPIVQEAIPLQALAGLADIIPTPIQRLALPALLGMQSGIRRKSRVETGSGGKEMQQFLLAAETGSGKTLAYLLPVIDAIKRAEADEARSVSNESGGEASVTTRTTRRDMYELEPPSRDEPDPSTARPKAIILVPTSELVEQVGHLAKSLSHTVKLRCALVSASYSGKVIRSRLFSNTGVDLVVCTPHLLNSITESEPNILSRVSHLVIDEADSLLDKSFSPITSSLLDRATPSLKQLILCSATIPKSLDSYLHKRFQDIKRLVTPNLHAIPRRVQLSVVDIDKMPYQGNRDLTCAQVIWDVGKEATEYAEEREKKIVVFVNEREKTLELAEYLRKKGIDAFALSRDSDDRKQSDILSLFTNAAAGQKLLFTTENTAMSPGELMEITSTRTAPFDRSDRSLRNTKVLVTTDIASRGIDTLPAKHVILYDVPHTSIDFIHRLGRVGRMNRRGRGIVLVGRHDRKDIVREIREGMFKGQALI